MSLQYAKTAVHEPYKVLYNSTHFIADPPVGAQGAPRRVVLAVFGGGGPVHQVDFGKFLEKLLVGHQLQAAAHPLQPHVRRVVELQFQLLANLQ